MEKHIIVIIASLVVAGLAFLASYYVGKKKKKLERELNEMETRRFIKGQSVLCEHGIAVIVEIDFKNNSYILMRNDETWTVTGEELDRWIDRLKEAANEKIKMAHEDFVRSQEIVRDVSKE